ncbi:SGNH/GDSL hydrolase family protein [Mucilaginibacter rubeus]|uniref:SGNH/GDSL hydrolase family protein n=1 Tax=Mucilaginibacter rubeus TaxID=2027860 RepID=A0A5C1I2U7_9SPHI|nr:SGNH/GDSL hydrolase family protein [Mucilaginibacter rubeus]QEM11708.1 SGNH/GDSL hydrolase family protein [Mucilaginibacter rubeus]
MILKNICAVSFIFMFFSAARAQQSQERTTGPRARDYVLNYGRTDTWKGFTRFNLNIGEYHAYYVSPVKPLPGNPWIWRASFPDWHTDIDSLLLAKGFHVAYVNVDDQYGSPAALQVWDRFYDYLVNEKRFAAQVCLEGVSRGGLYVYGWAKRNPDKISCIYNEAPVCDIKSWPGGKMSGQGDQKLWQQLLGIYHMTESQAMAYKDNPVDNLEGLAAFKVPVIHVIGPDDRIVPNSENTYVLAARYNAAGGSMMISPVTDGPQELSGHHFPIPEPTRWADMIVRYSYPVRPRLPHSDYFNRRGGLDNSLKVFEAKKNATVAFLGGSITFNPGWREKISRYLRERFPETAFHFIQAGIPSLGSVPHAFRLKQDVLDSGKVDLMFVEAAVNDRVNGLDSLTEVRALEGIVRHARKSNPVMDIVLMSFADPDKLHDYSNGKIPVQVQNHELVADRYGLPSVNLAKEVADRIHNHEFSWDWDFKDLHPAVYGQELYYTAIRTLLDSCYRPHDQKTGQRIEKLPKVLDPFCIENGNYYSIRNVKIVEGWTIDPDWSPVDQTGTRDGFVHRPMLIATKPGASLILPFKGTAIGISIVSGPDAGTISYSIDNGPVKNVDLYTQWSGWLYLPWYITFDTTLGHGNHTLKLAVNERRNKDSKGNTCQIINFLTN